MVNGMGKEKSYAERFKNGYDILCRTKSNYRVWDDVIHLYAYSLANGIMNLLKSSEPFKSIWEEREDRYLTIINTYSKREQKVIVQMFALLAMEYEMNPYQDLLGRIYMMLGINQKNKSQFFTSYDVSKLMAEVLTTREHMSKFIRKQGYASVCDECCGAGSMLIAFAEKCSEMFKKHDYRNHVYFVGQDIDELSALMCYIQLTLIGLPGYVCIGDTLKESQVKDLHRVYFTPAYLNDVWTMRRIMHGLNLFMEKAKNE